jgi:NAD-dependent dihydropyrimidine dehydrogenase PreA subunit
MQSTFIFCRCEFAHVIDPAQCEQIEAGLTAASAPLTVIPDLCGKAAARDPALLALAATPGAVIIACHPRAVHALLRSAGFPLDVTLPAVMNLRRESPESILSSLGLATTPSGAGDSSPAPQPPAAAPDWQPWFPVIDYSRCTGCRQCVSFCPFGVYTVDAGKKVQVTHPRQCKNNCPACARICPEFALIFPKVNDCPIDGSEVLAEHIDRRKSAALNPDSDIHALLALRRQRAGLGKFERNLEQAEQERAACLRKAGAQDEAAT